MVKVHIISLFPEVCKPYFEHSILGRAVEKKIVEVRYYNPIDEVEALKRVDDKPYGGGPGMVMKAQPLLACFEKVKKESLGTRKVIFLTPGGDLFTQKKAKEYAQYDNVVLLCGHYEGMDERIVEAMDAEKISVGTYTLTGGEVPALLIIDALARELPDVLGNENSCETTRIAGNAVYTRPETFKYEGKEYTVPEILLSGHHKKINEYRDAGNQVKKGEQES